ncbi:hypothetical protein SDJN03_05936, partial [Cucurbita argyrosperma subsp. sororia]
MYIPPHSHSLLQHTLTLVSECSINGLFPFECSLPKPNARSTRQSEEVRAQATGVSRIVSVVKNRGHSRLFRFMGLLENFRGFSDFGVHWRTSEVNQRIVLSFLVSACS